MAAAISKAAIDRGRAFVEAHARPLERAHLAFVLDGPGHASAVMEELARFQTSEGGFGRSLEPDVRGPAPSAICTSVALQHLRTIGAPGGAQMVRAAIGYLLDTLDRDRRVWPAVDERVGEGPHAPWWEPGLPRFRGYVLNPTAELLGYLYDYRADVPDEVLDRVTARVLEALSEAIESPYELHCCMRLAQTRTLPDTLRADLERRLAPSLHAADPEDYPHLDLLRLTPRPNAFGYDLVRGGLERQAERLIGAQDKDGGWRPAWEPWNVQAQEEWAGVLTSQAIVSLTAHGFVVD
jgi:hypothetical protein